MIHIHSVHIVSIATGIGTVEAAALETATREATVKAAEIAAAKAAAMEAAATDASARLRSIRCSGSAYSSALAIRPAWRPLEPSATAPHRRAGP